VRLVKLCDVSQFHKTSVPTSVVDHFHIYFDFMSSIHWHK